MAAPFLTAVIVCLIVNWAVNRSFTWVYIVIGGCIMGYGAIASLVFGGKYRIQLALLVISIMTIPYLFVIERAANNIMPKPIVWAAAFGTPVAFYWLAAVWTPVLLWTITRANGWFIAGISVLACYFAEGAMNWKFDQLYYSANSWRLSEELPFVYFLTAGVLLAVGGYMVLKSARMAPKRTNSE